MCKIYKLHPHINTLHAENIDIKIKTTDLKYNVFNIALSHITCSRNCSAHIHTRLYNNHRALTEGTATGGYYKTMYTQLHYSILPHIVLFVTAHYTVNINH